MDKKEYRYCQSCQMGVQVSRKCGKRGTVHSPGEQGKNEFIYNKLLEYKGQIERDFGSSLIWDFMEGEKACRIKVQTPGNVYDEKQWDAMRTFMIENMLKLEKAMKGPLDEIKQKLKESPRELDLESEEVNG